MSNLLTNPTALATSGPALTACPPWCTQHDDDFQTHNADPIHLESVTTDGDVTTVRTTDVFLDAALDNDSATVRFVINGGEMFSLPADRATRFALAILAQAGKTGAR